MSGLSGRWKEGMSGESWHRKMCLPGALTQHQTVRCLYCVPNTAEHPWGKEFSRAWADATPVAVSCGQG